MDEVVKNILEICAAIILSLGGAAGIIVVIIKFSVNQIASSLEKKYQLKLDKELEKCKASLDGKLYVTKSKYDLEIDTFKKLSSLYFEVVALANELIPPGLSRQLADKTEQAKIDDVVYKKLEQSLVEGQKVLFSLSGFIPSEFYNLYLELHKMGMKQCNAYSRRYLVTYFAEDKNSFTAEEYARSSEMSKKLEQINDNIREHINSMVIIE